MTPVIPMILTVPIPLAEKQPGQPDSNHDNNARPCHRDVLRCRITATERKQRDGERCQQSQRNAILPRRATQDQADRNQRATDHPEQERTAPPGNLNH